MSKFVAQPELFMSEDRGYGRGVGSLITPTGTVVAIHHEQDEFANVCIKEVYSQYLNAPKEGAPK